MSDPTTTATCSFCGKQSDRVVEAPNGSYACWDCLLQARQVLADMQKEFTCNFCLEQVPVNAVVEGPNGLHMCTSCVESGIKLLNRP
jgi:hypothetical protein